MVMSDSVALLEEFIKVALNNDILGECVEASNNADKESLAHYKGKFWTLENGAVKPSQKERDDIRGTVEKFHKK